MDEGLILDPPVVPQGSPGRLLLLFVCTLFAVALVGTALVDSLAPLPEPELIGEEKFVFEQQKARAELVDGSSARLFERKLQLRSRVREWVTRDYSFYLYRHLGMVRPVVLLGRDGWLFHKQRALSVETEPNAPLLAACSIAAMERTLSFAGIDVISVCIPRKAATHPGMLPRGTRFRFELDQTLSRELRMRGVTGPDLLRVFQNNLKRLEGYDRVQKVLYLPTDSHWTPRAELLTARATARDTGLLVPRAQREGNLENAPFGPAGRDMVEYAGLKFTPEMNRFLAQSRAESWRLLDDREEALALHAEGPEARVIVCGTSFTARRRYANFLAHFIGEKLHNAAKLGGDPTQQLARLLKNGRRPELVVMEYPNHSLFSPAILRRAGEVYGHLDYAPTATVLSSERMRLYPRYTGKKIESSGFTRPSLTDIPDITHSGDGVLAWRVRGEAFGAGVTLRSSTRPALIDVPWPREKQEVLVPIVSPGASSSVKPLLLRSNPGAKNRRGKARIDSLELVLLASEEDPLRLTSGESESKGGLWYQDLVVPEGTLIPDQAVLAFSLLLEEEHHDAISVEITGRDPRAPVLNQRLFKVARDSRHFINLNAFAGSEIASIRVLGRQGKAPAQILQARILKP